MLNKKTLTPLALCAALLLPAGTAVAESQYGYNSAGVGTVVAQARVNLSITVPKLILLRVGATNTTQNTLTWNTSLAIPGTPGTTTPSVTANTVNVDWTGVAPSSTISANPTGLAVYAWTNNATGGQIGFTAAAFGAGGPTLSNIGVTAAGTALAHPGANLGTAGTTNFPTLTAAADTWNYSLTGTSGGWVAGVYTAQVVYTATSL